MKRANSKHNSNDIPNKKIKGISIIAVAAVILLSVIAITVHNRLTRSEPGSPDIPPANDISNGSNGMVDTTDLDENPLPAEEPLSPDSPQDLPESTDSNENTDLPTEPRESITVCINQTEYELTAMLDSVAEDYNCVAASIAVFLGEDGVFDYLTYNFGFAEVETGRYADEETKFRVASLTKYVVAMLAMSLVESNLLELDADISDYLGYEIRNPNHPDIPISTRMLMRHTSSITDSNAYKTIGAFDKNTVRTLLRTNSMYDSREPGEMYEYSDFAYAVLGDICEKLSGRLLGELANEVLFEPLGIDAAFTPRLLQSRNIAAIYNSNHINNRTVQRQLDINTVARGLEHNHAIGGLMISALDYAKILAMIANGGILDGVRILTDESVEEIHYTNIATEFGYRQGLMVRFQRNAFFGDDVYWHTGSAYGLFSQFVYCRISNRGVVVVTTGIAGEREPNGMIIACNALAELVW